MQSLRRASGEEKKMEDAKHEYLTIAMTARPPIRIRADLWPVIASATWEDCDRPDVPSQANREAGVTIEARRHEDGRIAVSAVYHFGSLWPGDPHVRLHSGYLRDDGESAARAIRDAITALRSYESILEDWAPDWNALCDECIANLPAEDV
jgi:hypothetical protein